MGSTMTLKAIDYEILRGLRANSLLKVPLARKPIRVATLIDEAAFEREKLLIHNETVFLEDRFHDWDWADGAFRYYTRVAESADVLVVYEIESK